MLGLVELEGAARRRVKGYSLGMRQRLGLAAALLGDPELLILDEPANGLDPEGVRWLRDFLRAFAAGGRTVLVSSHVLAEVAQTVDRVLIVNRGRLVTAAPLAELTARISGQVRVRSPQPARSRRRSPREGIAVTADGDGVLLVDGATSDRVGEIAAAAGIVLHELVTQGSSLEQVFLELTSEPTASDRPDARRAAEDPLDPDDARPAARPARPRAALRRADRLARRPALAESRQPAHPARLRQFASLFAAIAGVLVITSEYRFGTIRPTFVSRRSARGHREREARRGAPGGARLRRHRRGARFAVGRGILSGPRHRPESSTATSLAARAGSSGTALWAGIGVGLGAILRNHVAAVITLLVWIFVVDSLLFGLVPRVGRFTPTAAMSALVGDDRPTTSSPRQPAGAILVVWVGVLAARRARC